MMHTSQMDEYAVQIKRKVYFFKRPEKTRQKQYRESKPNGSMTFPNQALAAKAAEGFNNAHTKH